VAQILLVFAVIAVSTAAPLIKAAAPAPALTVAAFRICIAGLLLCAISGVQIAQITRLPRRDVWLVIASGGLLAVHFGTWITSLYLTSTAASVALVATQPVFAGLLGWLAIGDRVGRFEMFGIAVAAIGCGVIGAGDFSMGSDALVGDGLALVGAASAAGYFVVGRRMRKSMSLMPYLAVVNLVAGACLLGAVFATGAPIIGFEPEVYAAMAACAIVPSVLGHSLLNWCVRRIRVHLVALAILGEPVGASLLTWALFAEQPPIYAVLGGAVVLVGIGVGFIRRNTSRRKEHAP